MARVHWNSSTAANLDPAALSPIRSPPTGDEIVFVTNAPDITGDGSSQVGRQRPDDGRGRACRRAADDVVTAATGAAFTPDGSKLVIEGFSDGGGQQIFETDPTS